MRDHEPYAARNLALLGLGALLGCVWSLTRDAFAGAPRRPGPVAVWVADRDGQALVGLDRSLFPAGSVEVAWPTGLAPRRDGGVWMTSSERGSPRGPHQLVRLDASGRIATRASVGVALELRSVDRSDALLIVAAGDSRDLPRVGPPSRRRGLWRVCETGEATVLLERDGLTAAAGRGLCVVAGTDEGRLLLLAPSAGATGIRVEVDLGGAIADVEPGPRRGTWWALALEPEPVLYFLGADLAPVWSTPAGIDPAVGAAAVRAGARTAERLIPVPGEERVWLAGAIRPTVRRYGPGGALELERADLPLSGLEGGLAWDGGGVLLCAPGAVLHLDRQGRSRPGQGGFRQLVGLVRGR